MKMRILLAGWVALWAGTSMAANYQCGVVENKENGDLLGVMQVDTSIQQGHQVPVAGGKIIAMCQGVLNEQSGERYLGCGQFLMNTGSRADELTIEMTNSHSNASAVNLALAIVPEDAGFLYLGSKMPDPGHLVICNLAQ